MDYHDFEPVEIPPPANQRHEHQWPADLDDQAVCEVPGCGLHYEEWSE